MTQLDFWDCLVEEKVIICEEYRKLAWVLQRPYLGDCKREICPHCGEKQTNKEK